MEALTRVLCMITICLPWGKLHFKYTLIVILHYAQPDTDIQCTMYNGAPLKERKCMDIK